MPGEKYWSTIITGSHAQQVKVDQFNNFEIYYAAPVS
jgi:hypothetical protein